MLGVKREYDTHSHTHSPLGDSVSRSLMTRSTRIGWSSFPASKWYAVWPIFWLTREHDDNGTFVRPTYELMKKCDFCTFDDNRERKILGEMRRFLLHEYDVLMTHQDVTFVYDPEKKKMKKVGKMIGGKNGIPVIDFDGLVRCDNRTRTC